MGPRERGMISGSVLAPMSFPPQVRNGPVPSEEGQAASPWARKSDSHAHVFSPCQRSLQRSGPVWGRRLASLPGSDPSFLPSCPPEADAPPTCETGSHLGGRRESEQQPIKWFWSMRCPRPPSLAAGWLAGRLGPTRVRQREQSFWARLAHALLPWGTCPTLWLVASSWGSRNS